MKLVDIFSKEKEKNEEFKKVVIEKLNESGCDKYILIYSSEDMDTIKYSTGNIDDPEAIYLCEHFKKKILESED